MTEALAAAFAANGIIREECITQTNAASIEIYDCYTCEPALQRCYIKTNNEEPIHFHLINPQKQNLAFAALDNCILGPQDAARCDFIIGNFTKLYFVEIKQVKTKKRHNARDEAFRQLANAITFLKEKINLETTEVMAVICLNAKKVYPVKSATSIFEIVRFKARYNATLLEGQSATF